MDEISDLSQAKRLVLQLRAENHRLHESLTAANAQAKRWRENHAEVLRQRDADQAANAPVGKQMGLLLDRVRELEADVVQSCLDRAEVSMLREAVQRAADPACPICEGSGLHQGVCVCVNRRRAMGGK